MFPGVEEGTIFKTESDAKKQRTLLYYPITADKKHENQSFEELRWRHEEGDYREDLNLRLWIPSGAFTETLPGYVKKLVTCSPVVSSWDCILQLPSRAKKKYSLRNDWISEEFKNVIELFQASSDGDEHLSYYCHKVIIVARAPRFFEMLTNTSTATEAETLGTDDEKKSNSNITALGGSNLETIRLNDKVSSRVLEVFLYYSYFEERELDVFNNEQLLELINLCSKISAQGLVNVAITELGKRLRKGQQMYLKYLENLCLTNNFPSKQVSGVQLKQAEMDGDSTETQTKMEAERAVGDNKMLCDEHLNTTDFLEVPFPQSVPTDFNASFNASDTSELTKEMLTTSTTSYNDELPEEGHWWRPLHLIAMTKEWNIPYLEDVLINAHILLNYEENAEYEQDETSIQNIPTTILRKMVKLHTGCFRDKKISDIDPEVQAVRLGRSLNDDLYRLFDEQDPR